MRHFLLTIVTLVSINLMAQSTPEMSYLIKETTPLSTISTDEFNRLTKSWNESNYKTNTATADALANRNLAFKKVALANEDFLSGIEKSVIFLIRDAIEKMDVQQLKNKVEPAITFSGFEAIDKLKLKKIDGIGYATINTFLAKEGSDAFLSGMKNYIQSYSKIQFVDAKLTSGAVHYSPHVKFEQIYMPEFTKVQIDAWMEVRGIMKNGMRRHDKFLVKINLNKKSDQHQIAGFEILSALTAQASRLPSFITAANNGGFDSGKVYARLEAIRRGGYAFAVEDFNNDGRLDAFVGNYGQSSLWLGQQNGDFVTVTEQPEVAKITLAKAAAFADLDNDGWKDLVITRFAADNLVGDIILFKNEKGTFKEIKEAFPSNILRDYAMPMAISDYNNDGLLDIYVGFPGERDFSAGPARSQVIKVAHGLFLNKGGFKFFDDTKQFDKTFRTSLAPHGALASDVDMDGKQDIIIMDDRKSLSPIFRNNGDGTYTIKNKDMRVMNYGYGMGIAAGDFNGERNYTLTLESSGAVAPA